MKKINFTKISGAGNDFIIIDALKGVNLNALARKMCHRTDGIGADGILVLGKSKKADYRMRILNSDGSESDMCGNGARCLAAYIKKTKKPKGTSFTMETRAGIIGAEVKGANVQVQLSNPRDLKMNLPLTVNGRKVTASSINTGVPHAVIFVDDLENINVSEIGRVIRNHKKFKPRGTNVNFVEQLSKQKVCVRTYERGVEDETRACGTGSVASGIIAFLKANPSSTEKIGTAMQVKTKSGEILKISFDLSKNKITNVWLKGSANFIAKGEYYV